MDVRYIVVERPRLTTAELDSLLSSPWARDRAHDSGGSGPNDIRTNSPTLFTGEEIAPRQFRHPNWACDTYRAPAISQL
jgi:hypothetical protein